VQGRAERRAPPGKLLPPGKHLPAVQHTASRSSAQSSVSFMLSTPQYQGNKLYIATPAAREWAARACFKGACFARAQSVRGQWRGRCVERLEKLLTPPPISHIRTHTIHTFTTTKHPNTKQIKDAGLKEVRDRACSGSAAGAIFSTRTHGRSRIYAESAQDRFKEHRAAAGLHSRGP